MSNEKNQINIGLPIHKLIESNRESIGESAEEILMRLLNLPADPTPPGPPTSNTIDANQSWHKRNVELPHGTKLRMGYDGCRYSARINNSTWEVELGGDWQTAKSPSEAARIAARYKGNPRANPNGWSYWEVKKPGESKWQLLDSLRRKKRKPPSAY